MNTCKTRGFTLVEVIVVSVIVAVLALAAVLLYRGYANDARKNVVENLAASTANYLQAERNRGCSITGTTVEGGNLIPVATPAGLSQVNFTVPINSNVTFSGTHANGGIVTATVGAGSNSKTSGTYKW